MGYAHGTKWSIDLIKELIIKMVVDTELGRMPTRSEVNAYFHDTSLTNAISKRCGWYQLAESLGLQIKNSETTFGKKYEKIAAETLTQHGYAVQQMPQNYPYDLLINGCVKIDVKASRLYRGKNGSFYEFHTGKRFAACDIYILYAVPDNGPMRPFILPSKIVPTNQLISIGQMHSKYFRYENQWRYIKEYCAFFGEVS